MKDYHCTIKINAPAEKVYKAITTQQGIQNWWTSDCVAESKQGGKATMRFGNTFAIMQFEKLTPYTEVQWKCLEQYHEAQPPLKKKNEWDGTRIVFKIKSIDPMHSELDFIHNGLNPAMECYHICEKGWDHFLKNSLKGYLENGKGTIYQSWQDNKR